jgi:DNA repair exonuclease SbcCD ATPase subunit
MRTFARRMRHKLHEVEHRLDSLKSSIEVQAADSIAAIRAHIAALDEDAHKAQDKLERAQASMLDWVDDAKEVVGKWQTNLETTLLQSRADRSEQYADNALVVAMASVDHAERAMLSADLARGEADAIPKSVTPSNLSPRSN